MYDKKPFFERSEDEINELKKIGYEKVKEKWIQYPLEILGDDMFPEYAKNYADIASAMFAVDFESHYAPDLDVFLYVVDLALEGGYKHTERWENVIESYHYNDKFFYRLHRNSEDDFSDKSDAKTGSVIIEKVPKMKDTYRYRTYFQFSKTKNGPLRYKVANPFNLNFYHFYFPLSLSQKLLADYQNYNKKISFAVGFNSDSITFNGICLSESRSNSKFDRRLLLDCMVDTEVEVALL